MVAAGSDVLPGRPEVRRRLAALSSDSVHLVVKDTDNVTLITRREHALTVVEAIRQVAERANARRGGAC